MIDITPYQDYILGGVVVGVLWAVTSLLRSIFRKTPKSGLLDQIEKWAKILREQNKQTEEMYKELNDLYVYLKKEIALRQ